MDDLRLEKGMQAQKELLEKNLNSGKKLIGWKLGFGSPTGLKNLNLENPLVGFILDDALVSNNAKVDTTSWIKPAIETEIAVYFKEDITNPIDILEKISHIGPAIELADLDHAPVDPERILAGDIFQKNVILGSKKTFMHPQDLTAQVNNEEIIDLENLTGNFDKCVKHFASVAIEVYGKISKDDFLILGSIVPPIFLTPGQNVQYQLLGFETLSVSI